MIKNKLDKNSFSGLIDFARDGNLIAVKDLVNQYMQYKGSQSIDNDTILAAVREAILSGHKNIAHYFINEQGICPNRYVHASKDDNFLKPLITFAVKSGSLDMVKLLIDAGAHIKGPDWHSGLRGEHDEAICTAVKEDQTEIALFLLEQGAPAGFYLLETAAFNNNRPLVKSLISNGARVSRAIEVAAKKYFMRLESYRNEADKVGTVISTSSENIHKLQASYYQEIQLMLDYAAGVDFSHAEEGRWRKPEKLDFLTDLNIGGFSFVGVSFEGEPITREMLMELGFKNAENALFSLDDLKHIEDSSRREELERYIEHRCIQYGVKATEKDILNLVPLWRAAEKGDWMTVKERLNAGIDPNQKAENPFISEPIISAAKNGHLEVVKLLGTDKRINESAIVTAKFAAIKNGHQRIVDFLEQRVDVNIQDNRGDTQLHHAVFCGNAAKVETLLKIGADLSIKNNDGHTPMSFAIVFFSINEDQLTEYKKIIEAMISFAKGDMYAVFAQALDESLSRGLVEVTTGLLSAIDEKTQIKQLDRVWVNGEYIKMEYKHPWYRDFVFKALKAWGNTRGLLEVLKEHGAEFNLKDQAGSTPLTNLILQLPSKRRLTKIFKGYKGEFQNIIESIDFLLANGVVPTLSDKEKLTSLHHCLLEIKTNINVSDEEGNTIEYVKKLFGEIITKLKSGSDNIELAECNDQAVASSSRDAPRKSMVISLRQTGSPLHQQPEATAPIITEETKPLSDAGLRFKNN